MSRRLSPLRSPPSLLRSAILAGCSLLLAAPGWAGPEPAASWNRFRGPNGSGILPSSHPPATLDASSLAWKTAVPPGMSSPVLANNGVFLTALEGTRLVTLCLDAGTGRERWRREAPRCELEKVHAASNPAAPTPCVDDRRVYVYFGSYGLLCYDFDGVEQWTKPIPTPKSLYGMAGSPVLHEDRLILVLDDDANLPESKASRSRLVALHKATGEPAWEAARPTYRSGWSTPALWSHSQGTDLVVLGSGRGAGYDPRTGEEKWSVTGFSRETIATPVVAGDLVCLSSALLGGVSDEQPDPLPFWTAMLAFDTDGDSRISRAEAIGPFTFPLRPELPIHHPGFGLPLSADPARRAEQQARTFASHDRDKDGYWTRDEFLGGLSFRHGKPVLVAVRPGGRGDVTTSHVAWELRQGIPEIPSPLVHGDRLYLVRNGGILTAVNVATGKVVYAERLGAPGQYSASPVASGTHLYLASNRGVVSVVDLGETFRLAGQFDLGEPVLVTPALDANTVYVRTEARLVALRRPAVSR